MAKDQNSYFSQWRCTYIVIHRLKAKLDSLLHGSTVLSKIVNIILPLLIHGQIDKINNLLKSFLTIIKMEHYSANNNNYVKVLKAVLLICLLSRKLKRVNS